MHDDSFVLFLFILIKERRALSLWKHSKEMHDGYIPVFRMSVPGQFINYAMLRQVSEAARINR